MMRCKARMLICMGAIVVLSLLGCQRGPASTAMPGGTEVAASTSNAQLEGTIRALGTIRPAQTLSLSFGSGGPVQAIVVGVGTAVRAGDVLAELDTTALALELESAGQSVVYWQAAVDGLRAGASPAEVERAEAAHAQQLVEAELALEIARQKVAQAERQSSDADVIAARSALQQLESQLAQSRASSPDAQAGIAQVELERARDVLAAAQDEYGKALDRPWEPQEIRDALAKEVQRAEWEVEIAEMRLTDAERAQQAHALGAEALAARRSALHAQLDQALAAQASYSDTLSILSTEVALAEAWLSALRSWQNPLLDPPSQTEIAQVEAQLRQAQLTVEQLQWQAERSVLHAPFDGVIAAVHVRPGEWVAPGAPILEVIDASHWYVETRNVSELSIGQVRVGQRAIVEVLALDRTEIEGAVDTISPVAVVQQGDTTYTLMVAVDATDLPLRPGMNAQVQIELD
jgi:multidrug resistance efflux pump